MAKSEDNSNYALERLRELMVLAHLAKDEKLPTERELAQQLGVSRRPIRRALEVLEAEGSIWRRQGAGTFLQSAPQPEPDHGAHDGVDVLQIMEARLHIEPQLSQLAALRATPQDVAHMQDLAQRIRQTADADARELWDGALHRLIAQSAGNAFLLTVFDTLNRVRQSAVWQNVRETARGDVDMSVTFTQHDAIIAAIANRDIAAAGEAMLSHLLSIQENLIRRTAMISVILPVAR